MAVNYLDILRNIALRAGAAGSIIGSNTATIESNFNNASFGSGQVDNPAFPFSAQCDALLFAEEKIAETVAGQKTHPLRKYLRSVTANLPNRNLLPKTDAENNPVIGVYGNVRDAADEQFLVEIADIHEIERLIRLQTSTLKGQVYKYAFDGQTILHTRANVKIEVCKYNRATQKAAITANSPMLFPDTLEETLLCGAISFLSRPDEPADERFLGFWNKSLNDLMSGRIPAQ